MKSFNGISSQPGYLGNDCYNQQIVKANKTHHCSFCGEEIHRGELHITHQYFGSTVETVRLHGECHFAARDMEDGDYLYGEDERPGWRWSKGESS